MLLKIGAVLKSSATYGGFTTTTLSAVAHSPTYSASPRRRERVPKIAPTPHPSPLVSLKSSEFWRSTPPNVALSWTAFLISRLPTRSTCVMRALVPAHSTPPNDTATRGARLIASPSDSERTAYLAPTMMGAPSVFDQPRRRYGKAWSTPASELVSLGRKVG